MFRTNLLMFLDLKVLKGGLKTLIEWIIKYLMQQNNSHNLNANYNWSLVTRSLFILSLVILSVFESLKSPTLDVHSNWAFHFASPTPGVG